MMEEKRGRTEEREKECRKNRKWRRGRVKEELHRRKGRKTIFGRRGKVKRRTEVERKKENRKRGKKERERRARGRGKGGERVRLRSRGGAVLYREVTGRQG